MDLGSVVLLNLLSPWSRSVEEARMLNRSFSLSLISCFSVLLLFFANHSSRRQTRQVTAVVVTPREDTTEVSL